MGIPPVTIRGVAGLWTSPNPFSKVPEGALTAADECVIRANGVLESRRGYDRDTTSFEPGSYVPIRAFPLSGTYVGLVMSSFDPTQHRTFTVYNTSSPAVSPLSVLMDGTPQIAAPYSNDARVSVSGASANQNLMLMSQNGPQTIPYPLTQTFAASISEQHISGLSRCPAPALSLIAAAGNAVMNTGKRRTYRVTAAWYDSRGNFFESAPSEPIWIENTTGVGKTVQIAPHWPLAAQAPLATGTSGVFRAFFRIWRALETVAGVSSSDEMFLVREVVPSAYPENTQGFIDPTAANTVNDVSIDSLLNVPLYTNPQTGDGLGIFGANRRPPVAGAIAYFKGRMLYGRPTYQQSLEIQIIGTGTGGVAPGDTLVIDGITYTAGGFGLESLGIFNCPTTAGVVAQNIETAARSLVECVRLAYASGSGATRQINRQLSAYYASNGVTDFGRIVFERPLPISLQDDAAVGFSVVTVSPGVRFPGGTTVSADDYLPGGVAWSKPDEPEAVPDVNFQIVGDANKAVLGWSVHRDAAILYKEDGAYICRDDGGAQPTFDLLDASVVCVAPASIAVVSNLAYLLATRGVLQVSEQGTELMGFPVGEDIEKLYRQSANALANAYGIAHEADRLYILALPASVNELSCSIQYVLRVPDTESPLPKWTIWHLPGTFHGCVVPTTNQIVFGFRDTLTVAGGVAAGVITERRGNVASLDYVDYRRQLPSGALTTPAPAAASASVPVAGDLRYFIGTGDILSYNPGGLGTKVYTPRVTAVAFASNTTTLTLDQTVPFSGGFFTHLPAIRAHWRFAAITAGEPTMEKQWTYLQAFFGYFDGDWLDAKLDSETTQLSAFGAVYADPQLSNLGGEIALSFPGSVNPNPSPSAALSTIQWLRNCRDVILRVDPAVTESRGARLGVEMQFAQANASFRLMAVSAKIGEANDVGVR